MIDYEKKVMIPENEVKEPEITVTEKKTKKSIKGKYRVMSIVNVLKVGNDIYKYGDIFYVDSLDGFKDMVTRLSENSNPI